MTCPQYYLSSQQFRDRAEEARTLAHTYVDPGTRATMLRLATSYEKMALQVEELADMSPPAMGHDRSAAPMPRT